MKLRDFEVGDIVMLHGVMQIPDMSVYIGDISEDGSYALLWKNVNDYIDGKKWDIMAALSSRATLIRKTGAA